MKKYFNYASMILLACAMVFTMTACGGDDDDSVDNGNENSTLTSKIVGKTWYVVWESSNTVEVMGFSFRSNGTGTGYELKRRSSDNFSNTEEDVWNFKYSITGNIITTVNEKGKTENAIITDYGDGNLVFRYFEGDDYDEPVTFFCLNSGTLYDLIADLSKKHQK